MRAVVLIAGFAVVAAICSVAVGRLNDRELVIPPPDAVAEGFFREIVTERLDQAKPYVEQQPAESELQALHDRIELELGRVDDVKAELLTRTDTEALVTVQLESASGSTAIPTALLFSDGEWKLERVP